MKKALLSWSSGKDSAWALRLLLQREDIQVVALLTTFNSAFDRVAMHGVRRSLVELQADRMNLPLWPVELPWPCPNASYEELMRAVCQRAAAEGVTAIAFGDLFLEDIRAYRERQLSGTGLEALFPLWKLPTRRLASQMMESGMKSVVTCVDPSKLEKSYAGRCFDSAFLDSLPAHVDPCGENGEFHTFVYDGPVFSEPIPIEVAEIVQRDGFVFADVTTADLTTKLAGIPVRSASE